jgi:hypothetical protein
MTFLEERARSEEAAQREASDSAAAPGSAP